MKNTTLRYADQCNDDGSSYTYHIELDYASGNLSVNGRYSSENTITFHLHNGHGAILEIYDHENAQNTVNADALDELLASYEVAALTAKISDGYSSNWDGSNHIGSLTYEAQAALDQLQQLIYNCDRLGDGQGYWSADQWLTHMQPEDYGLDENSTKEDIAAAAQKIVEEAASENVLVELSEIEYELERKISKL